MRKNQWAPAVLVVSGLLGATTAEARLVEDAYIGAGVMPWTYEGSGEDIDAIGGRLTAGVMLNEHLGLEAHFGWMGEEDSGTDRTVELDSVDSVFVRFNRSFSEGVDVYALAGFSSVRMVLRPFTIAGTDEAPSASGPGFGLGAQFKLDDQLSLGIDAINYLSEPDFDFVGLGASLRWHF